MKVKIEIEEGLEEEEVVIRCAELNDTVISIQNYLSKHNSGRRFLTMTNGETDFYVPVEEIYFFETEGRELRAHTADKIFTCGYKLYELEELLPGGFMRISKSTIANLDCIYSITRNLTASSMVEFTGSRKRAMVSRVGLNLLFPGFKKKRHRGMEWNVDLDCYGQQEVLAVSEEQRMETKLSYANEFGDSVKYVTG